MSIHVVKHSLNLSDDEKLRWMAMYLLAHKTAPAGHSTYDADYAIYDARKIMNAEMNPEEDS